MPNCEHCQNLLLDHVYGLLDQGDSDKLRAHLSGCPSCQAALGKVEAEKKLMARAARAISEVPEFALPGAAPSVTPATLPMIAATPKRSTRRHTWIAWAAAAAVLFAIATPLGWYQHTVNTYQTEIATARKEHKQVETQLAALPAKYDALHKTSIENLRTNNGYIHVVGPKTLQPNAKAHVRITTRQPDGSLASAAFRLRLVEAETGHTVHVARLHTDHDGQALAEIDACHAKPNSTLNLIVEHDPPLGASVQEAVRVPAQTYVTRIDTNKAIFAKKDKLFCRVLVLDRYTLQPPAKPIVLQVELAHNGKAVRSFDLPTGAGGIVAAEFPIDEKFQEGAYVLNVRPVGPAAASVQSASVSLEVVRDLTPDIQFNASRYSPGDLLAGTLRSKAALPKDAKAKIDGQSVRVNITPQAAATPGPGAAPGGGVAGDAKGTNKADAKGEAKQFNFELVIPPTASADKKQLGLSIEFGDGKRALNAVIPLQPTEFAIDLFPEGGDLVAGVQNRVFYRVRSKLGEPVTGEGQVILLSEKNDVIDSSYQLGMGYLDFTPELNEKYTIRITTPRKVENVPNPFANLGIRAEGVVLQVAELGEDRAPCAVGTQGDPIRLTLRSKGPARKLLLLAHCRGQIVDERWVEVSNETFDVTLQPTPDAHGMIRVTAYQVIPPSPLAGEGSGTLEPIAERLVYRAATQRLDLGFLPNAHAVHPGKTTAKISAHDEKGHAAPAWILASVVDERFQARPRSLSAHFLLLNEIRTGADLDEAQLILHDSPESTQVLERFLGTHGWRRYVPAQESAMIARAKNGIAPQALVFSRENVPLAKLQTEYEAKLAEKVASIQKAGLAEQAELVGKQSHWSAVAVKAARSLGDFQEQVQLGIRIALGALVALLLAVSLILMSVGVYRVVRAHKAATPSFGGAFACLAICMGVMLLGGLLGPVEVVRMNLVGIAEGDGNRVAQLKLPALPAIEKRDAAVRPGAFAPSRDKKAGEHQPAAKGAMDSMVLQEQERGRGQQLMSTITFARRESAALYRNDRDDGGRKPEGLGGAARQIEYPRWVAETLLWHPTLWLANGDGEVHFEIPDGLATYRVILLGHGPSGRFGFYETRLDVIGR